MEKTPEPAETQAAASLGIRDLFRDIEEKRRTALLKDAGPYPKNQPTASDISDCVRETALAILHWDQRPPLDDRLMARLEVGREFEAQTMAKLIAMGVPITDQQSFVELAGRNGRVVLRGKCDGKVEINRKRYPFDIKSCHPNFFNSLTDLDRMKTNAFARKWVRQIQVYEFGANVETGFILLVSLTGEWRFIEVPLDWEAMEAIYHQAEEAVEAAENVRLGGSEDVFLPPFHKDPSICQKCWAYKRACFPPVEFGEGMIVLDDPDLEAKLDRLAEVKGFKKEAESLDKEIKGRFEGAELVVVGDWMIKGEEKERNYKAQPATEARTVPYWQTKIERITEREGEES